MAAAGAALEGLKGALAAAAAADTGYGKAATRAAAAAAKVGPGDALNAVVAYLRGVVPAELACPEVGIVCGSGLSRLTDLFAPGSVSVSYSDIPGYPVSTVEGHASTLVFGVLAGKVCVAMKGRFHYYEGYAPSRVIMGVRTFAALGVRVMLVTNAAGGVNPTFNVGDVMIIEDQISWPGLAGNHPMSGHNDDRFGARFFAVTGAYAPALQIKLSEAAASLPADHGIVLRRGTYVNVAGPTYESKHEVAALRTLGADSTGMSTSFEVMAAAQAGIKVLGLSLITNKCLAPGDDSAEPTHEEVLEATDKAARGMLALVNRFIGNLDTSVYAPSFAAAAFTHIAPDATPVRKAAAGGCTHGGASVPPLCLAHMVAIVGGAAVVGAVAALAAVRLFKLKL